MKLRCSIISAITLAMFVALSLGCTRSIPSITAPAKQPLALESTFAFPPPSEVPIARLNVALSRLPSGRISVAATLTNESTRTFSSTSERWLYTVSGRRPLREGSVVTSDTWGKPVLDGPTLAPGDSWAKSIEVSAVPDGDMVVIAQGWFAPTPSGNPGNLVPHELRVQTPVERIP